MRASSMAAVGVLSLSGARIAAGAPPAPHADDPMTAIDDAAAVHAVIAEGASCIPRALAIRGKVGVGELELQLGRVAGVPVLCAIASDKPLGTVACWDVDVRRKRLAYRPPQLLPGQLVSVKLTAGCSHGLCIPASAQRERDTVAISVNDTGELAAISTDLHGEGEFHVFVFDRASKKLKREVTLETPAMRTHTLFVGHAFVTTASPAGPMATPVVLPLDGNPRGPKIRIGRRERDLAEFDIYDGAMSLLRTGHVALIDADGRGALDLDVAADTGVELRPIRPIRLEVGPVISIPSGYLVLRHAELVVLDRRLRPASRFSARCTR
jgi:hypothetical protein